jgi:hypothetical protein
MRKSFCINATFATIVILVLSGSLVYVAKVEPAVSPEPQTAKFLTAVQKKDFKTIFDTTSYYQLELSQIRSANPKALWGKLTAEYYESEKKAFLEPREDYWRRFAKMATIPNDSRENIRVLATLLTPSASWKVSESKKERRFDPWSGSNYDVFVVYVTLKFKTVEESPLIGSKVLKETIIGVLLDAKTGLYMQSSRYERGDSYWGGDPLTDFAVARKLYFAGLLDDSIDLLKSLRAKGALDQKERKLLAAAYFSRVKRQGFVKYNQRFYGLQDPKLNPMSSYTWRPDIEEAISLDEATRGIWVNILYDVMQTNLKVGEMGLTVNVATVAKEFSRGYPELESKIQEPIVELAGMYIDQAKRHDDYLVEGDLRTALSLSPREESIRRAVAEEIKQRINRLSKESGYTVPTRLKILRQLAKSLGLNLEL